MDCTTAAWLSVTGGVIELIGIVTVAVDLAYTGRVPNLKVTTRKLLRQPPPVQLARSTRGFSMEQRLEVDDSGVQVLTPEPSRWWGRWRRYGSEVRRLEQRIGELRADLGREVAVRAEADARLERSIQDQLQSLQNEITDLRRDLIMDRARATSRPWIPWVGIVLFIIGLGLNTLGTFLSAGCT